MTRKDLYVKIKELGVAAKIQAKFGKNYTLVSNADLGEFLKSYEKSIVKRTSKKVANIVGVELSVMKNNANAITTLLSILQTKKIITAKEAEEVAKAL